MESCADFVQRCVEEHLQSHQEEFCDPALKRELDQRSWKLFHQAMWEVTVSAKNKGDQGAWQVGKTRFPTPDFRDSFQKVGLKTQGQNTDKKPLCTACILKSLYLGQS